MIANSVRLKEAREMRWKDPDEIASTGGIKKRRITMTQRKLDDEQASNDCIEVTDDLETHSSL